MAGLGIGEFVSEKGAVRRLPSASESLGLRPMLIAGATAESVAEAGGAFVGLFPAARVRVDGQVTRARVHRAAEAFREAGCTHVIGIGGGRAMDYAKAVAHAAGVRVINVPTSIATCAASAQRSIMYDEEGRPDGNVNFGRAVDVVLVDEDVVGNSPRRLTVAGWLDALAKQCELVGRKAYEGTSGGTRESAAVAEALAQHLHQFLSQVEGPLLVSGQPIAWGDAAFAHIVEASLITSLEPVGDSGSVGHPLYYYLRREFPERTKRFLHGEVVGLGLRVQAALNRDDATGDLLARALPALGLPLTLGEARLLTSEEEFAGLLDFLSARVDAKNLRRCISLIWAGAPDGDDDGRQNQRG